MRVYREGHILDTEQDELLFDTGRKPRGDEDGYLLDSQRQYYATKDRFFYYVVTNWIPKGFFRKKFSEPEKTVIPRTLDELAEASGIDKKEIGRTYRFVTRELGIRILPSNPVDYLPRFASALRLSAETQSKAVEILEMAQKSELTSGRGPTGIAAASLYVAALINNEKRTQREVADIAGVTEVTIRNRYKELLRKLKLKDKIKAKKE